MKFPKNWNKMKLHEQEEFLVNKLTQVYALEVAIKKKPCFHKRRSKYSY